MKRVLLKLSGEALAGEKKTGFDEATVSGIAGQVKALTEKGIQIAVVTGGGNFWRGRSSENMDRTKADQIGMLATVMNCIYVSEIFRSQGLRTHVMTPFLCGSFTELFSKDAALAALEKGEIVFFAGGTGHPYFSTDTATLLRAIEIEADEILLAKSIDGVYDDDPKEFIKQSLKPANVISVDIPDEEVKACSVVVPDNQLSLAIGNKGQNAKLAARLTGYKIDIKPESGFFEGSK